MMDTPFAITLGSASSRTNRTGAWRVERPVYRDLFPPCAAACPAGENVREWLHLAQDGDYEAAWREIMSVNPFPAIMGRVCYRPCETACNRGQLDETVGINSVERFLGDEAIRAGWTVSAGEATGRRVLVVGAGPAGLAAAYHLRLLGHDVTIRDSGPEPGGMMRFGIPAYRLPRDVLDAEIRRIVELGVTLELNTRVGDVADIRDAEGFDAVFLAVGAQLSHRTYVPAGDSAHILDALSVLRRTAGGAPPLLGRRVAVYGGGNTAVDVARTARRLGAADALIVYRRTRDRMPAHESEVTEAEEEGVRLRWLSTIAQADEGRVTVERMRLDESGFPQPTGEFDELDADAVVLALGQDSDLGLVSHTPSVATAHGRIVVDGAFMTGLPGVFAGGDAISGDRTVTSAIGHGRRAAQAIDAWLRETAVEASAPVVEAAFEGLNPWYYTDAPRQHRSKLEAARRTSTFDEVVAGLDAATALFEARRCLSCGGCFECDNCYSVCPDNAVIKLGPGRRYEIDLEYCKGCGLCAAECPAGAIAMIPEQRLEPS
ncbi:4Fe-4S dicluster domain-containing protein [Jiangella rhizosphaerae]|uniref:4Fe-4S dicluster domain-containing protein n=2 Tax=Jiangella rhizosphaerae TaxID=2293569 RepID=A0A418KL39_9ACTN|nr:4Fe-4S dicluster domain-containing protein [Jiangella rhizosphaerae]